MCARYFFYSFVYINVLEIDVFRMTSKNNNNKKSLELLNQTMYFNMYFLALCFHYVCLKRLENTFVLYLLLFLYQITNHL